ncbi:MAG: hypoxanthine phosphoribosyltransferase [Bradymonadaceae bacterium]
MTAGGPSPREERGRAAAGCRRGRRVIGEQRIERLIGEREIRDRVAQMGRAITEDFEGRPIHAIGVLKGSFMFLSDLVRRIELDVSVDFLGLSSYGSQEKTTGVVRMTQDLTAPIEDRHVLIVEDIIDTGLTMSYLLENLGTRRPESLSVCTLLHKPVNTRTDIDIDYVGFEIPDEFVIGYGLDYVEYYRNVPYIGVLRDEDDPTE